VKVVVAHNQYSSSQPSGENVVVAGEIASLTAAGVTVLEFLRSSDEMPSLPLAQRAALPMSPVYARSAQRELDALLARERPDVVHLHNPYPLLSPWVVRTAHARGVPVVHTVHNFRQTCVNGLQFRDNAPCYDCVGRALPTPAVRHSCYRGSRAQSAVMAVALTVHRGTWRRIDRLLALTPAIAEYVRSLGVPPERVVVRPNSVPDPGRHSMTGDGFLVAGRLSAEKGIALLLEAWRRHRDGALGQLRIAGNGPLTDLVRAQAGTRSDIEYLGTLDHDAVVAAMRQSSVVVVPSVWDEVCPMVAVESMANARPVLGTNRGGLPWLIGAAPEQPTPAGWLVESEPDALAAMLPAARAEAARLSAAARRRYEDRFTPARGTASLIAVYEDLARSRRAVNPLES
jgi:glycosyltransferase involved in cell wall biosynthesis